MKRGRVVLVEGVQCEEGVWYEERVCSMKRGRAVQREGVQFEEKGAV